MPEGTNPLIRPYEPRDREALDACIVELQNHEREIEPRMKAADDMIRTYVDELQERCAAEDGVILVAEMAGEVVGYTTVFAAVPNDDPDEIDYTVAYVHDIAVRDSHRGQAIGTALLKAAEAHALERGATCLRISVLAQNKGALALYERLGFEARVIELEKQPGR